MNRCIAIGLSGVALSFIVTLLALLAIDAIPGLLQATFFQAGYWDFRSQSFSALAMLLGTLWVGAIALGLAAPVGLAAALFVSEVLQGKTRALVKMAIELLAGVPSVVYGLIGVTILLPLLNPWFIRWGAVSGDSLLAAGILLAIMILPTMMTFADDACRCVPRAARVEGLSLGMSKLQVIKSIVLPQARGGIIAAVLLSLGRALGETIAIYLVIGRSDQPFNAETFTLGSLLRAGQTFTTKLGSGELTIAYGDPMHWQAMMGLACCLWLTVGASLYFSRWGRRLS